MQILIKISNLTKVTDIIVDTNKNLFLLGNDKLNVNVESFTNKLLTIVNSWPKEMINDSIIDGESYSVTLKENNKQKKHIGKNNFPANYSLFKQLISEVTNERN